MKFRLCPEDRVRYPADQEWFEFSIDLLADQAVSWLEHFEKTTGYTIRKLGAELDANTARSVKAALWAGRRIAGVDEDFATWDPKVFKADLETDPADAGPLASPRTRSSAGTARTQRKRS